MSRFFIGESVGGQDFYPALFHFVIFRSIQAVMAGRHN